MKFRRLGRGCELLLGKSPWKQKKECFSISFGEEEMPALRHNAQKEAEACKSKNLLQ
jgi:hypothetical protein